MPVGLICIVESLKREIFEGDPLMLKVDDICRTPTEYNPSRSAAIIRYPTRDAIVPLDSSETPPVFVYNDILTLRLATNVIECPCATRDASQLGVVP